MNEPEFLVSEAPRDLFCFRCQQLGITTPTILAGDHYISVKLQNGAACLDCWNRLTEEVQ